MHPTRFLSIIAMAVMLTVNYASAGRTDQGTVGLGVNFNLDFDGPGGTTVDGGLLGGYYLSDGVLVGGSFSAYDDDYITRFAGFLTAEQNFETGTPWIPYIGARLGLMHGKYKIAGESESATALAAGLTGGIKYFLTESIAIDLSIDAVLASDDVFLASGEVESYNISLKGGLRFFLF